MSQETGNRKHFKLFIDSLLLDLNSIESRVNSTLDSKTDLKRKSKLSLCPRKGFPANIVNVTKLGSYSLLVQWNILDRKNIAGYEIYLDGYLSSRYYNSQHEAAVIFDVNINKTHKVALMALSDNCDTNWDIICNNKDREILRTCKMDSTANRNAEYITSDIWTPSIYIYQPDKK